MVAGRGAGRSGRGQRSRDGRGVGGVRGAEEPSGASSDVRRFDICKCLIDALHTWR